MKKSACENSYFKSQTYGATLFAFGFTLLLCTI